MIQDVWPWEVSTINEVTIIEEEHFLKHASCHLNHLHSRKVHLPNLPLNSSRKGKEKSSINMINIDGYFDRWSVSRWAHLLFLGMDAYLQAWEWGRWIKRASDIPPSPTLPTRILWSLKNNTTFRKHCICPLLYSTSIHLTAIFVF